MFKSIPGLLLCFTVATIGFVASDFIGKDLLGFEKSPISSIMLSILLGMLIANLINLKESFNAGFNISLKYILKFGIICLGIRLGLSDIARIGFLGLPVVISCIVFTLLLVNYLSKLLNVESKLAALIAVGTSICGATAIVATGPVIKAKKEEITYAIANITIFGIIAMLAYPYLAHYLFSGNDQSIGLFLGTAIHETAQVAGAGLIYAQQFDSPQTLDFATVTKLVRNVSMIIVIPLMGYLYLSNEEKKTGSSFSILSVFPLFILGFILLGLIRTFGDYSIANEQRALFFLDEETWLVTINSVKLIAEVSLGIAMSAVGLSTKLSSLRELGIKPFYVGFVAAFCVGVISFIGVNLFVI